MASLNTAEPATADSPKSRPPRRRRILKRIGLLLLVIAVLGGITLLFLPQIATKLITRLTDNLELERFEVTVVEVRWNEAALANLDAADAGWQARAESIVVRYDPWDLLRGKVEELTLHELRLQVLRVEQSRDEQTNIRQFPSIEEPTANESSSYAWLHRLPGSLANCPEILAPGARITVPGGPESVELLADLALRRQSSRRLVCSLDSYTQRLSADLATTASGSTLTVQLSVTDPHWWLTTTETLLGAPSPYLPAELALGPLESAVRILITDEVESIALAGSMPGLRYGTKDAPVDVLSSRTTFEGVIRPRGQSQVDLRGNLSTCTVRIEEMRGEAFALPADARPTWTARLAWDPDTFSYAGTLDDLQLHGGGAPHPLEITHGTATFSNHTAPFQTHGKLRINGLELPFDFVLRSADSGPGPPPNASLGLGPVTLDGPQPLLAALLPTDQLRDLSGTFDAELALRLTPGDPVSGTIGLTVSDAGCRLAGDLAALGPLSGTARLRLPADDTPPRFEFEGTLAALTLDTSDMLGFPLDHRGETPAEINIAGSLSTESPHLKATVRKFSLAGTHNGHDVRFSDSSLEIDYRGPALKATVATHFGANPFACSYVHTLKDLPNGQWELQGSIALPPAIISEPITNAGAFSEMLGGLSIAGTLDSKFDFQSGSNRGFGGVLHVNLSDCTLALDDNMVVANGVSATNSVTFPADKESPVTWTIAGTAAGLAIDTSNALEFSLAHTADPPAAFTASGTTDGAATVTGTISKLTLDGEHRGEFVSFSDSSLKFRLEGDTLSADGLTTYAGNEIPFTYLHTRNVAADENWELTGQINIPLVSLGQAITNGGAFSEAAAGVSYSGKTAAKTTFSIGSDNPFRGTLDLLVTDGSVTLPDDGPALTGINARFVTPDLETLHTVKAERFSIGALTYGDISFTKLSGRYQIQPTGDITLSDLNSGFLGGRLSIDPFTYPDDDKEQFRMHIRFQGLNLRSLTALFPAFNGKLEGTIDGHLPVLRKNGVYQPERGGINLTPRTQARLRYNADSLFTGGLKPGSSEFKRMKIAEDSLKNLDIPILTGRIFDPNDKDRAAVIRIEGQSPGIKDAPPIHLNFNLYEPEGEFRQLLDYFFKNREKLDFGL